VSLRKINLLVLLLGLAALALVPAAFADTQKEAAPADKAEFIPTADELLSLNLINDERAKHDLAPLEFDPLLAQVAREHSADMAKRAYFDHIEPAPARRSPMDRYAEALGRTPRVIVGENIARCSQPLMGYIHLQLTDSETHLSNILDKAYARVGVGIYSAPDGQVWLTQMYCGKKAETRRRTSEG